MSKNVSVIVVAAGQGERFGGNENKVFAKVDGQPLFLKALQLFVNRDEVCQTILVVSPADMPQMKSKFGANLGFMGVQFVERGARRCDSVMNGLKSVNDDAEFVAVHDAARVCLAAEWIDKVVEAARTSGAAAPVVPVTATLKRVGADNCLGETVSRDGLYMAQTPQVFKKALLADAYEQFAAAEGAEPPTDEAQVVAAAGHPVAAVPGDPRNIKITTREDLSMAGAVLKILPQKPVSRSGVFEEAKW